MRAGGIGYFDTFKEDNEKPHEIGTMNFWLHDTRDKEFNETVDCCYALYGYDDDEVMDIERYWNLCRSFAAADRKSVV